MPNSRILVLGSGRIGKNIAQNLPGPDSSVEGFSSQTPFRQFEEYLTENVRFIRNIIWAGRDAALRGSITGHSGDFFESLVLKLQELNWGGHFTFISSGGTVYGNAEYFPTPEKHPLNPISQYGIAKVNHELMLLKMADHCESELLILRPSNIYVIDSSDSGLVGACLRSIQGGQDLQIYGGEQTRDFIHLNDFTSIVKQLIGKQTSGVLNVGSGTSLKVNALVALISKSFSSKVIAEEFPQRNDDVFRSELDVTKLIAEIGWTPRSIEMYLTNVAGTAL